MTDKIKQALVGEMGTIIWRGAILLFISLAVWTFQRQVDRIDYLEKECVKKNELCELKIDVKDIQRTLSIQLPEIARFMGQVNEYMRTH